MKREEEFILPLAERWLEAGDWEKIAVVFRANRDFAW
jgi:hypothetical protein